MLSANRVWDLFERALWKDTTATEEVSRKDAKVKRKRLRKTFASFVQTLRLCVTYSSSVSPNRFALLHERFHAFVRVLSLHQLVQIDVFLFA